jgi:hypothetical protein
MVDAKVFLEFLEKTPELLQTLRHNVSAAELFNLIASDFSRNAIDLSKAGEIVRSSLSEARLMNGASPDEAPSDYLWWIADGPTRSQRWTPDDGLVRRIGIPEKSTIRGGLLSIFLNSARGTLCSAKWISISQEPSLA